MEEFIVTNKSGDRNRNNNSSDGYNGQNDVNIVDSHHDDIYNDDIYRLSQSPSPQRSQ